MRVLFVTNHYLSGFGGAVFASRSLIHAFSELSDKLLLLCPAREGCMPEGLPPEVEVRTVFNDKSQVAKFFDLLCGRVHRFYGVFEEALSQGGFDTVVFDSCYPSFGLIDAAHAAACRIITIHHNFQYEYVRDNYRFPLRPVMRFWTRRCEAEAVVRSDLNLTLTSSDSNLLMASYKPAAPIRTIGIFEVEDRPSPIPAAVSGNVFLITGDLGITQTKDSLVTWLDAYYPILLEVFPDAELILAGKHPARPIRLFCEEKGIELIDTPTDMEPVLRRGRYYLCPVSKGGGLKLRIMDGLSHGLPVVTHTVSARGYEAFEGKSLFSYDDRSSFRRALEQLRETDISSRETIRTYRDFFSYPSGVARLRSILLDFGFL